MKREVSQSGDSLGIRAKSNDIISQPYPIPNNTLELNYGNQFEDMFVSYSIRFITNR